MLISLSGIDGSGKTTIARGLGRRGFSVLHLPDRDAPGTGEWIDGYLRGEHGDASPNLVQAMFAVNRGHHLLELWEAKHDVRDLVVVRYLPDGMAYGRMLGCSTDYMESLEAGFPQPDAAFLVLCAPGQALANISAGRAQMERFETLDYLRQADGALRDVWAERAGDAYWYVEERCSDKIRGVHEVIEHARAEKRTKRV